jgi:hypothetical protein
MATVTEEPRAPGTIIRLRALFLNPTNGIRIVVRTVREFVAEFRDDRRQRDDNVQPRMHRGLDSAIERAMLNGAVRTLSRQLAIAEMRLGTPVIYVDFTGYDSVAHHAGPERSEALRAVRGIDREIERMVAAIPRARRPYALVVLSDHGQSLGEPFVTRFGETIEALVGGAIGGHSSVSSERSAEQRHGISIVAGEVAALLGGVRKVFDAAAARARDAFGAAERGHRKGRQGVVVCASGNLAHVYLLAKDDRLTFEEIETLYPGLIGKLVEHPSMGCLLVRSSERGLLAIAREATRGLDQDGIQERDPLAPFGPRALESFRRLDGFRNVGDLVLLSTVDPETQEVVSFEDLVGCHGGLGGAQSEPFLLRPATWTAPIAPLVGAPAVNRQLREWLVALRAGAPDS